jgi:hypothetical protein
LFQPPEIENNCIFLGVSVQISAWLNSCLIWRLF